MSFRSRVRLKEQEKSADLSLLPSPPPAPRFSTHILFILLFWQTLGCSPLCLHKAAAWPPLGDGLCPSDLPASQLGAPHTQMMQSPHLCSKCSEHRETQKTALVCYWIVFNPVGIPLEYQSGIHPRLSVLDSRAGLGARAPATKACSTRGCRLGEIFEKAWGVGRK